MAGFAAEEPVHVFISVDMEGIAGVVDSAETGAGPDYEWARRLMTEEANAAVRGVLTAQPDSSVTVADAHGSFRNILPELLDGRADLIRGKPRPLWMMAGVDADADAAFLVGYHGRAGTARSVLAHTYGDAIADLRLNGRSVGEIGLNAALAGHFGVPVVLVTGDESVRDEVADLLPAAVTVVVKQPLGFNAAKSLPPEEARPLIEEAAASAVSRLDSVPPFVVDGPVEVAIDLAGPSAVERVLTLPRLEWKSGRTVTYRANDILEAAQAVRAVLALT
jgi:D-amino peptidase